MIFSFYLESVEIANSLQTETMIAAMEARMVNIVERLWMILASAYPLNTFVINVNTLTMLEKLPQSLKLVLSSSMVVHCFSRNYVPGMCNMNYTAKANSG